jgi:uncharacterized protein involved in exopolysaccharide biosynthesis/LysM repeat protein
MSILELLRLIRKHIVLLVLAPVLLVVIVAYLTRNPSYTYSSETTLFTGIATGGGVEMQKTFSFFATNTAFDNLINVIKSRNTQEEVGIRLLATHLLLDGYNPKYISKESYRKFKKMTPQAIYKLVVKNPTTGSAQKQPVISAENVKKPVKGEAKTPVKELKSEAEKVFHTVKHAETLFSIARKYGISVEELKSMNDISGNEIVDGQVLRVSANNIAADQTEVTQNIPEEESDSMISKADTFSFSAVDTSILHQWLPMSISYEAFEQTVQNLIAYMHSSDTNFVYKLLNFSHPHYSVKAISSVNVQRIANSDLVKLKYESDDPGICQHTLSLITDVCIKNYKDIKENRSDAVVKYFEYQVRQSSIRLRIAEDKLLKFNKDNNIINYYEQSKAVAVVKEDLDVLYNNKRMVLEGAAASIRRIETQLGNLQKIQLNSAKMLDLRNKLLNVNTKISTTEIFGKRDSIPAEKINSLKLQAEKLKAELTKTVSDIYGYSHSVDGLPISGLLSDWIKAVLLYEETKAGMEVLGDRIREFRKQYEIYAPAGANLKRIEREINVSEQAYLELLHGLNLAKLKMQDIELSSNIKAVDPPYFPLSPNPTKRSMLVAVAGLLGFLLVFITILATEYLDNTLRNPQKATKILGLNCAGLFPKVYLKPETSNFLFVANRLLEMMIQKINLNLNETGAGPGAKTILFFSTQSNEGKTVLFGNIARKMVNQGYKVLVLSFSRESLRRIELSQTGYSQVQSISSQSGVVRSKDRLAIFKRLLGYPDRRIDYDSPFLESPENYLAPDEFISYQIDESFQSVTDYQDILTRNHIRINYVPDYVLLEIPPVLFYSYPNALVQNCQVPLLVCRANRTWSNADQEALDTLSKHLSQPAIFLLNGVEIPVVETVLGELPKKRSIITRLLKKLIRFQFFERYLP